MKNAELPSDTEQDYTQLDLTTELRKIIVNSAMIFSKTIPASHLAFRSVMLKSLRETQIETHLTFKEAKVKGSKALELFYYTAGHHMEDTLVYFIKPRTETDRETIHRAVDEVGDYVKKLVCDQTAEVDHPPL